MNNVSSFDYVACTEKYAKGIKSEKLAQILLAVNSHYCARSFSVSHPRYNSMAAVEQLKGLVDCEVVEQDVLYCELCGMPGEINGNGISNCRTFVIFFDKSDFVLFGYDYHEISYNEGLISVVKSCMDINRFFNYLSSVPNPYRFSTVVKDRDSVEIERGLSLADEFSNMRF